MKTTKITDAEIADIKVSALPTRPTAPAAFGGKGYTASELKAAFDRLPLYIVERFNALIDDINGTGGGDICDAVKTGIKDGHTLKELFSDIENGNLLDYMAGPSGTLAEYLAAIRADINKIAARVGVKL